MRARLEMEIHHEYEAACEIYNQYAEALNKEFMTFVDRFIDDFSVSLDELEKEIDKGWTVKKLLSPGEKRSKLRSQA
jgi:hypothetical protein